MNPLLYHRFLYFPSHHLNFLTLEKQIERLEHYSSWSLSLLDWVQLLICRSKPKLKLKYISAKALAQLQKSIVKSSILETSYILDIQIQRNWLSCLYMIFCSCLHTYSKGFLKYKGKSDIQHHWSAAEIGHLPKPYAFKYLLAKPENDDYYSSFLIISFLSQKRNIKRERP